ncbi:HAMP domain-containing sensor histidine kinase [Marinoscillum sp. 108]|uniref:sensor histidine kinase n=1 Tax=Marinoscillum sp. 108 TaxID=2653151 RepID=UPI0012EF413E|nr:HAMP domain-containing sensor histidine kinase [Marinoscillum sp. 108]VXD10640.1 Signal transduction histidine kinase [Marinoscillum sp. 108]
MSFAVSMAKRMIFFVSGMNGQLLFLGIILVFGSVFLPVIQSRIVKKEAEIRQFHLENRHQQTLITFQESMKGFVTLMSGVRSYMVSNRTMPTQQELKEFLAYQLKDLNYTAPIIFSFVDTSHVFRYSFSQYEDDPGRLIGTSVRDIRSESEIEKLDAVMREESIYLLAPINMVEGMIGIPATFSVVRDEKVLGYVAAIVDFKTLINPIYKAQSTESYAHHFSVGDNVDFDRERIYDGSVSYHTRQDPGFYKNFEISEGAFLYSEVELYGLKFKIGTAAVEQDEQRFNMAILLYGWYLLLIAFVGFSVYRLLHYRKLNVDLNASNAEVESHKVMLEEQNRELQRVVGTKDKLFSIIGHDLRGPLSSIVTMMSESQHNRISPEEKMRFLAGLRDAAKQSLNLLDNLLRWSMVNTGARTLDVRRIDVAMLVTHVTDHLEVMSEAKQILLKSEIADGMELVGDRDMLSTVLRNIVSNAIKFSHDHSVIKIKAYSAGHLAILEVHDSGVGMTSEQVASLFKMDREHVSRGTRDEAGTGLGLIVSHDFIKLHHGSIKVESTEGSGSMFRIILPNQVDEVKKPAYGTGKAILEPSTN